MCRPRCWLISLLILSACTQNNEKLSLSGNFVSDIESDNTFNLCSSGASTPLLYDPVDFPGVLRALSDLQSDFIKVSGSKPELIPNESYVPSESGHEVIIAGTIGFNGLIDQFIKEGLLDVSDLKGKWESSVTTLIDNPLVGISKALVIAGSDKRGTIYGIYELSKQIGVSPWHYWADVKPRHREELHVIPGTYMLGEPAVKYRGIFINDEAPALSGWVHENFGGFNHQFYEHVFELILRMKGNYLWPAMWGRAFYDDDPENARLADEYGVVIGTTHHEPLMRAHVEWARYGHGPWDYRKNADSLQAFWREGIERMGSYESIVSLGMRGDGDEPMTEGTAITLLERIVDDQRKIIAEVSGKSPEQIPQLWALYKEVQAYYDKGMRAPGDVTLLLCDDNWGNIRKLPQPGETERKGGYGIYYHFDYVGGPRNYKWLNTTQIERVWEQMHLAYEYGADRIWIVNVGDIKPMELPTQFFLDFAWDPDRWNPGNIQDYYVDWARQQFGNTFSEPVGEILALYTKYNARRKPELLSADTYELNLYREAEGVLREYKELEELAEFIYTDIPEELKDAYYQLVLFPVKACANLNELYIAASLNRLYARQGRSATNRMAQLVRDLFMEDSLLTLQYHVELAEGKWKHMMSQTHIGYTYWQQPEKNHMPEVQEISLPDQALMGISLEHSSEVWPDSDEEPFLPGFDVLNQQELYIEIFNRGTQGFNCTLIPSESWIIPSATSLHIALQERIYIRIDWDQAPDGFHTAFVNIKGPGNVTIPVFLEVDKRKMLSTLPKSELFVENQGVVSMEAGHYQRAIEKDPVYWEEVPNLGKTWSSMITLPVTAEPSLPGRNAPCLEYDFFISDTGTYTVSSYLSPTLNFHMNEGLEFAVSVDDEPLQMVNLHENEQPGNWEQWVSDNINVQSTRHRFGEPGVHTLKWWRGDAGTVLQKIVISKTDLSSQSYLGPPESLIINPEPLSPD